VDFFGAALREREWLLKWLRWRSGDDGGGGGGGSVAHKKMVCMERACVFTLLGPLCVGRQRRWEKEPA